MTTPHEDRARRTDPALQARLEVLRSRRPWLVRNRAGLVFLAGDSVVLAGAFRFDGTDAVVDGLTIVLIWLGILAEGLYRSRFHLSALDDAPRLVGTIMVSASIVAAGSGILLADVTFPWQAVLLAAAGIVLVRALTYLVVRSLRSRHHLLHRALILGSGEVGQELAQRMIEHPEFGLLPVGFADDDPLIAGSSSTVPILGTGANLAELIESCGIEEVIVAFTADGGSSVVDVVRTADRLDCEVSVIPRLFELGVASPDYDQVNGIPLQRLRRPAFRSPTWALKRVVDVVVAGTALLILSPLLGLIALVLRLTDGPGVIFRQQRVGLDGRSFELLKFRSMRPVDEMEAGTTWNIKNDDRVGPVGRLIRRTSVDELPQLWNILRGDMSLVGPRPERPYFVATFEDAYPRYGARHRVPCGLTGWAQIHGLRGDTSIEERIRYDNYYIEHWSLWLDVKIILRTITSLMKGSG